MYENKPNNSHPPVNSPYMFNMFAVLWVTGTLMEMVDSWEYPLPALGALLLTIPVVFMKQKRAPFLIFLVVMTAYFVFAHFPEVANHINLLIFCNVLLILGLLYSYISPVGRLSFPAYFQTLLSPLRLMLIGTYFLAGFHKLNYDFINPEVSCIRPFLNIFGLTSNWSLFSPDTGFQTPVFIFMAVFAAVVLILILRNSKHSVARWALSMSIIGICIIGGFIIWNATSSNAGLSSETHINLLIVILAALIVFWQVIEGPLLFIRRAQIFILCFAMIVHSYLAMIGFVDFQSIALALIFTFVPGDVLESWYKERKLRLAAIQIDRISLYFLLNVLAGIFSLIHFHVAPIFNGQTGVNAMQGLLFNAGVIILLWPILSSLVSGNRQWRWSGVAVLDGRTPRFFYLIPVILLAFGMTSHLGLRTAGNFSMFSNLRTEGVSSNHILLASNPLKIFDYQEDTVYISKLDDRSAKVGHHYTRLEGMMLPVVEFRKQIHKWTEAEMKIPIVFRYENQIYALDDVTADPQWRSQGWDWEMRLLDFRVIQPTGDNRCRW